METCCNENWIIKKKKNLLSKQDQILWDLFTEKLDKSINKKNKKKDPQKIKVKSNFQKLHKLELGQGVAVSKKSIRNFNKGNVFIEDKLDLHGFTEVEASNLLENFINQSVEDGKRLILVITGKGKEGEGIIKNNIVSWLNKSTLRNKILAINYASKKHGGSGAMYILLKNFR